MNCPHVTTANFAGQLYEYDNGTVQVVAINMVKKTKKKQKTLK
jgi:hypothetical protein